MANRTAFEVEGWKRILPIRHVFEKANIDLNKVELTIEEVTHSNSDCIKFVDPSFKPKRHFQALFSFFVHLVLKLFFRKIHL